MHLCFDDIVCSLCTPVMHVRVFFIYFCLVGEDLTGGFVPMAALYLLRLRKKGKKGAPRRALPQGPPTPQHGRLVCCQSHSVSAALGVVDIRCQQHFVTLSASTARALAAISFSPPFFWGI